MEDQNNNIPLNGAYLVLNNQIYPLKNLKTSIGRKLDNDLVIQDSLISRYHAEIHLEDDKFHLVDLESTGGTFLNNKQVQKSVLYSGDIILLANVPIMFVQDTERFSTQSEQETGSLNEPNT